MGKMPDPKISAEVPINARPDIDCRNETRYIKNGAQYPLRSLPDTAKSGKTNIEEPKAANDHAAIVADKAS